VIVTANYQHRRQNEWIQQQQQQQQQQRQQQQQKEKQQQQLLLQQRQKEEEEAKEEIRQLINEETGIEFFSRKSIFIIFSR